MQSSQPKPSNSPLFELQLWHSISAGLIGGWILVVGSTWGNNYNKLTFFQLLLDPIFLVAVLVQALPAVIGAILLWLFCWIVRPFRHAAALTAFIGCLVISFGLFYGNYIEKTQIETPHHPSVNSAALDSHTNMPLATTIQAYQNTGNQEEQTTYSFSGLNWGDSIDVVDLKLKSAGFSGCATFEMLKCNISSNCRCKFKGSQIQESEAYFENNRLVTVDVYGLDNNQARATLLRKYGPLIPVPVRDISSMGIMAGSSELMRELEGHWKSKYGETIDQND